MLKRADGRGGAGATPPGPGRLLSQAQLLGRHRRPFDPRRDLLEGDVARHVGRAMLRLDVDAERPIAATKIPRYKECRQSPSRL
jgi:hypothetical protein